MAYSQIFSLDKETKDMLEEVLKHEPYCSIATGGKSLLFRQMLKQKYDEIKAKENGKHKV